MKILRTRILLFILTITLFLSCGLAFLLPQKNLALAEEIKVADKTDVLIPKSFSEYFDFTWSNPKGAIYYNDGAILIREDKTLWIYDGFEYVQYNNLKRNNPTQVALYNQKYLIVSDNAILCCIDLTDLTSQPVDLLENPSDPTSIIPSEYFYLYENKLLTKVGSTVKLFTLNGLNVSSSQELELGATPKTQTPVAINSQDQVFFISSDNSKLYKQQLGENEATWFDVKDGITEITATQDCIYFIKDAGIYKIENGANEVIKLEISPDENFELGKITTPLYLSVNEDKLLISDSGVGAITEFRVNEDNTLTFTGYAIAKGKTAYNRLPLLPTDIDLDKNSLKIYNDFKVLDITLSDEFDSYDVDSFNHVDQGVVIDKTQTTDVFNNLYSIKDDGTGIKKLYKNQDEIIVDVDGITKLESDLFGNLYCIKANTFRYLDTTDENAKWVTILTAESNILSFTMDIENQTVYYLLEGSEFIYKTNLLNNAAIETLTIKGEYVDKYSTVTQQLKAYQINEQSAYTIYSVNLDKTSLQFTNVGEGNLSKEYAYLATASFKGVNGEKEFIYLADTLQTVLVDSQFLTEKTIEYSSAPEKAFITMPVNGYFLPLITNTPKDQIPPYALTDEGVIRLAKEQVINPTSKFIFLDQEYYLANFTFNEQTVTGYLPVSFTVPVLAQDKAWETYRLEHVEKTYIYKDSELKEKIMEIAQNSTVKIIKTEKGVMQVIYQTTEGPIEGYISASKILDTPNTTVTTVLIVLAACASICGTLTFFILRKKKQ